MKILLFIFLFFSLNIYSVDLDPLSDREMQLLLLDDVIRSETLFLNELFLEGMDYADRLVLDEEKVSSLVFSYASEGISNEDLWIALDSIKDSIFKVPDLYEEKISRINHKSQSNKEFFIVAVK